MKPKLSALVSVVVLGAALGLFCPGATAQIFTVENGSMIQNATGEVPGWEIGTSAEGRECGPYNGSVAYQAINSPTDSEAGSGSMVFTATATYCSFTQQLLINASGQSVSISADVAWDGDWDYIYFGFYTDNDWDRVIAASIDITPLVPADTDGTLDNFVTVTASGTLPSNSNPVRVFFGSSCDPWTGGPLNPGTSKFAVDNVRALSAVNDWNAY